jgi:coenzyme PQQ precursor peptide PqqA
MERFHPRSMPAGSVKSKNLNGLGRRPGHHIGSGCGSAGAQKTGLKSGPAPDSLFGAGFCRQAKADTVFGGKSMTWTTPEICEVCVGMEVTSYESAEI